MVHAGLSCSVARTVGTHSDHSMHNVEKPSPTVASRM